MMLMALLQLVQPLLCVALVQPRGLPSWLPIGIPWESPKTPDAQFGFSWPGLGNFL